MTDWREELIEEMAKAIAARPQDSEDRWWIWEPEARAALAVAEPVIREQCAEIADREANADTGFETSDFLDGIAFGARVTAKAIREGGND